jgi:SAM-dependent methyltransferase
MCEPKPLSWLEFWEHRDFVYVGKRHRAAHYQRIAQDILSLKIATNATILDYGCGDALEARLVTSGAPVLRLCLYDASSAVRARLRSRFATESRIAVLDNLAALSDNSLDLIIVNSVLQYVSVSEFMTLLAQWRALLKPGGRLVLGDVISPKNTIAGDTFALLGFAWRQKFLWEALVGLITISLSDYRRLRRDLNLTSFSESDMLQRLSAAGFVPQRRQSNLGFNRKRMTFIATRPPG